MDDICKQVILGALLHDIGKIMYRASEGEGHHGRRFRSIAKEFIDESKYKEVLHCIEFHHERYLQHSELPFSSIAYIVCEADNIAAGLDRRQIEGDSFGEQFFNPYLPLVPVFETFKANSFSTKSFSYALRLVDFKENSTVNMPEPFDKTSKAVNSSKYAAIFCDFMHVLKSMDIEKDSVNSFLKLAEVFLSYVPSSTNIEEVPDISLYNHLKMTAAISSCLYLYFKDRGIENYKEECFNKKYELRDKNVFLLVTADISGIQNFIYTISSKGALKSLRGRSLYLEILAENIIDEILEDSGLSRANLIYSGGGHFYLLLPNTEKSIHILKKARKVINSWLANNFSNKLYLEVAWIPCTANDLGNELAAQEKHSDIMGRLFESVNAAASINKLRRYDKDDLVALTSTDSEYNKLSHLDRECSICGTSSHSLVQLSDFNKDTLVCENCRGFYELGDKISRLSGRNWYNECSSDVKKYEDSYYKNNYFLTLKLSSCQNKGTNNSEEDQGMHIFKLPSINGEDYYVYFMKKEQIEGCKQYYKRIYSINSYYTGRDYSTNLWAGTYTCFSDEDESKWMLADFEELAKRSRGIKRLGVLRADVDNLGQAFINGFVNFHDNESKFKYCTLSRYASLSSFLSMFFKFEINKFCSGTSGCKQFDLVKGWQDTSEGSQDTGGQRDISIVYSGGDDIFIVGAWDQVLEFGVELRQAFKKYTLGKMTLSAGFSIFDHSYPVAYMAQYTGYLEDLAKNNNNAEKDSISLFGEEIFNGCILDHIYKWDTFIEKVCLEKLSYLYKWFDTEDRETVLHNDKQADFSETSIKAKLRYSSSFIYRLLHLFRKMEFEKDKFYLAMLAYAIARAEERTDNKNNIIKQTLNEMKSCLYEWANEPTERKQFITALYIFIYLNRKGNNSYD